MSKFQKATRRQIIEVGDVLRAHWNKDGKDYVNGWSDERIATLTKTTVGIVKGVRLDLDMKKYNKGLQASQKLKDTVEWHGVRLDAMETQLKELREEVLELRTRP